MDISAILPIYNCRERLERHLRSVIEWVHCVEELIVVDSGSTDGSLELAREILLPYGAKFIHNPPGLYESWNAGVEAATRRWIYFSTVEDPITADGLEHLYGVITRNDADVVISPPEMWNHDGSEKVSVDMPSNRMAEALSQAGTGERLFSKAEAIALFCGFLPHGILGSSASNLYRSSLLKQHPFPTNFGHCGDTAWGIKVAPLASIAFTSRQCARFLLQTTHSKIDPESQKKLHRDLANLTKDILRQYSKNNIEIATMSGWFSFLDKSTSTLWEWTAGLEGYNQELKRDVDALLKQVDYLKEALNTIKLLQEKIVILEKKEIEIQSYYGLKGALKYLRKSFYKKSSPK